MVSNQGRRTCQRCRKKVPANAFPTGGGATCRKCNEAAHQERREAERVREAIEQLAKENDRLRTELAEAHEALPDELRGQSLPDAIASLRAWQATDASERLAAEERAALLARKLQVSRENNNRMGAELERAEHDASTNLLIVRDALRDAGIDSPDDPIAETLADIVRSAIEGRRDAASEAAADFVYRSDLTRTQLAEALRAGAHKPKEPTS